jgi:hypothetical protein
MFADHLPLRLEPRPRWRSVWPIARGVLITTLVYDGRGFAKADYRSAEGAMLNGLTQRKAPSMRDGSHG